MAGIAAARVPGVMAAAAALATVATSTGFHDRVVPPIMFYTSDRPLLLSSSITPSGPSFSSCCSMHPSGSGNFSRDSWSHTSLAQGASNITPVVPSFHSGLKVLSCFSPLSRGASVASTGTTAPLQGCQCVRQPQVFGPLRLSPAYLYSTLFLQRGQPCRPLSQSSTCTSSSFTSLDHSASVAPPPSPANPFPSRLFGLSSRLGDFSLFGPPPSHLHTPVTSSKSLHSWHLPTPGSFNAKEEGSVVQDKPAVTVVLLGWLGSQQKHLKKYADWYNARGIHAVTFTVPMGDILSFSMGGKAEEHVEKLTNHLSTWLAEESKGSSNPQEKQLIFHTFSNTGWLTYGVVLEKLSSSGDSWVDRIKGCVVDSAPAADPDPQVWASGFSAALLKKRSSASVGRVDQESANGNSSPEKHDVAESALLAMLEKFFAFFLQIPAINQRLSQVVTVLSQQQPPCPQLYIYSTADKVIPVSRVESFMEKQREHGRVVRGCNFQSSPHVDHFRTFPEVYSNQVNNFLQECLQRAPSKVGIR